MPVVYSSTHYANIISRISFLCAYSVILRRRNKYLAPDEVRKDVNDELREMWEEVVAVYLKC
jgi:hypothetical protein